MANQIFFVLYFRTIGFFFYLNVASLKPEDSFLLLVLIIADLPETQFYYLGWDKTFRILVLSHDRDLNIRWYLGSKGEVQDN